MQVKRFWFDFYCIFACTKRGALNQRAEITPSEPDPGNAGVGSKG